jgi:hypothetical protein
MKILTFIFSVLISLSINVYSQSKIIIHAETGEVYELKSKGDSAYNTIEIILPENNFAKLNLKINGKISFSFNCDQNDKNCFPLRASDIDSGRIFLQFNGKVLSSIGGRVVPFTKEILSGNDTLMVLGISNNSLKISIPFFKKSEGNTNNGLIFESKFCKNAGNKDTLPPGLKDLSFLCQDKITKSNCNCGIPVQSAFQNMYLPTCFDKEGNALTIKNHVLYDLTETDPLKRFYLFKIKKSKIEDKADCGDYNDYHFEYSQVNKRICPIVGSVMAISVIAHKDSVILINSDSINFFLDSAQAVQTAFDAAGNNGFDSVQKEATKAKPPVNVQDKYLNGAVTLNTDLLTFNSQYNGVVFLQEKYDAALKCLQVKISDFFLFNNIPSSGQTLASAIESKLIEVPEIYKRSVCELLKSIASEYDIAIKRKSDYRIFTKIIQVPNVDELNITMSTSKAKEPFYSHIFQPSLGIKIDFSTGIFITGLNSKDFILQSLRFKVQDSANGAVRDTVGNLIQINDGKFNYNAGFLVHVYPRTGYYVNAGLATGVTINNSDFMWVLGGSLMFRMGPGRLSLVGGWAFGKQKALDANHQQYLNGKNFYPENKVYLTNNLPRLFTDTNINTYEKRQTSWFVGITYNFASLKL